MRGHRFNNKRICTVCGRPEAPDQVDDFCFPTPNEQILKPVNPEQTPDIRPVKPEERTTFLPAGHYTIEQLTQVIEEMKK